MPYYRKKPIPIEARQYFLELMDWSNGHVQRSIYDDDDDGVLVYSPEGPMWFNAGDYIIKGVHGEFYPCQKDIFEETHERI